MKLNYCPNCGTRIEGDAGRCPSCGVDLRTFAPPTYSGDFREQLERMMRDLVEHNEEALREMAERIAKGELSPRGLFFSVEIRDGKPIIRSGNLEEFQRIMENAPLPAFLKDMIRRHKEYKLEFREAEVEVSENPGGKEISVRMPGVENIDEVEINKRNTNLEIAGKSASTVYFAQVPLERSDVVVKADLQNGVLRVMVKKS
jgi:HSP20 family molecular chaperone IbpA